MGKGRGGAKCHTNARFGTQNCMTSQSKFASSEGWQKPISRKGAHDQQTLLTSIGSILTLPKLHLTTSNKPNT